MKYLFVLILISFVSKAQDFKLGKVSKDELRQNYYPLDSTASAAVLYSKGELKLNYYYNKGWVSVLKLTRRIKIYNRKGYGYATVNIPYYSNKEKDDNKNIDAFITNIESGKVITQKLDKRDIIYDKIDKNQKLAKFTFPNLKPGSVIEYSIDYYSSDIEQLFKWKFQNEIPVKYSEYELTIPKFFAYNEYLTGFHPVQKDVENIENVESGNIFTKALKYNYKATDVPKLVDEPFVNNHENYMTSIQHELAVFRNPKTKKEENYTTKWFEVVSRLEKSEYFGSQLKKTKYFESIVNKFMNESSSQDEIIEKIFKYVKGRVKWNANTGLYCSDDLINIFKNRVGNIADINLMLVAMLRYAGFQAMPVLISTIDNGIPSSRVSLKNYNYVIASIEFNDKPNILLDASEPFASPNILPVRCLNWHGRLVRPDGSSQEIRLNPNTLSKNNFILNLKIEKDASLTGQMRRQYTNHFAYQYRKNYSEVNEQDYINSLENEFEIEINDIKIRHIKDLSKPVTETISFSKRDAVEIINNNIYISPLLFLTLNNNPFKQNQKERKLPINFTFPKSKKYIINIDIPDDYKVDYMPKPLNYKFPENKGFYRFNIQTSPSGNFQISVNQSLNQSILGSKYYQPLKEFYDMIVNKETDKIVLVKK